MIVHGKSDVWIGAKVRLNDGRLAEVEGDGPCHESVLVTVDGSEPFKVYVGEALPGDTWIQLCKVDDNPQPEEPELEPVRVGSLWDELFDGIDPDTFDGDILDLM